MLDRLVLRQQQHEGQRQPQGRSDERPGKIGESGQFDAGHGAHDELNRLGQQQERQDVQ